MSVLQELAIATRTVAAAAESAVVSIGTDGRGTGVVVAAGKVLTNAHNLRDRTTSVRFADGRIAQGAIVGSDADGDLVVLAVDTTGVPVPAWASATPELGDFVFGASRDNQGLVVTAGQVSAVARSFSGPRGRRIRGGIEHTVPLRRGSSGGPLLTAAGEIAGINTHRLDRGFYVARPADEALRQLVDQLASGQSVRRRQIGVVVATPEVTRRLRRAVGLPEVDGLLVRDVVADGPAATAGIVIGDVLLRAGEIALVKPELLIDALESAGETVVIHIARGAEELDVTVSLVEQTETASGDDAGHAPAAEPEAR